MQILESARAAFSLQCKGKIWSRDPWHYSYIPAMQKCLFMWFFLFTDECIFTTYFFQNCENSTACEEAGIYLNVIASERRLGFLINSHPDWQNKYGHSLLSPQYRAIMEPPGLLEDIHHSALHITLDSSPLISDNRLQDLENMFPAFSLGISMADNDHLLL